MTIVLFGLLGSGKSTIGKLIAHDLHHTFVEMDYLISHSLGDVRPQDVSDAVWKECQVEVSKDLSVQRDLVIAGSGNIVENDLNILYFRDHAEDLHIIYIDATTETLLARNAGNDAEKSRALRTHLEELRKKREGLYRFFADTVIETDNKTPRQIANEILSYVRQ